MIPWRYKVTWDDGRIEEVTVRWGDLARFEAKAGKSFSRLMEERAWTSWCDALIVHTVLSRTKAEPVQSFDEFLDSAELELLQFGEPGGKAPGRAASSGRSPRSRSSGGSTP